MESRLRMIPQGRLLLIRFCFCWIHFIKTEARSFFGAAEPISRPSWVLQRRFWYYRIDFGTNRIDFGTTQSIQNRFEGSERTLGALRGGFRTPDQAQRGPKRGPRGAQTGPQKRTKKIKEPRGSKGRVRNLQTSASLKQSFKR